jgi:dihydroorotase
MKILVRQATIADPDSPFNGQVTDILINGNQITKIAPHISESADEVIEAAGLPFPRAGLISSPIFVTRL